MSHAKSDFIIALQEYDRPLSPYEISQAIREKFSWVCLYRADPGLDPSILRGYMVRPLSERAHSPTDPAGYWCVISGQQPIGWQNLVWTKEMLQALDASTALTTDQDKLGEVLDMDQVDEPNHDSTPPHVVADKNGFRLALGCAAPRRLREKLRESVDAAGKLDPLVRAELESIMPAEYVEIVLTPEFETRFQQALDEIC